MRKRLQAFLLLIVVFLYSMNTMAFALDTPEVAAEAAILVEATTGKVLYEKNSTEKMYPASMTKIVTALVALDYFSPDTLITVGNEINQIPADSSKAGHTRGETLTTENLLRGLLIPSGNDSANVLAVAVVRKVKNDQELSYSECQEIFSDLMNEKAAALGAKNTHFANAHGYHDDNHYTTAEDMAKFSIAAMKNDTIKKIALEASFSGNGAGNSIESDVKLKTRDYNWINHNLLITDGEYHYDYATGLKTGFTDEAGACIAATATKDDKQLVAVVFHSPDPGRWEDAKTLFEFGFNQFGFADIQKDGDLIDTVQLSGHNRLNGDSLQVIVKEDISDFVANETVSGLQKEITYRPELLVENKEEGNTTVYLKAPIEKDEEVGSIAYKLNGETKYESKIYAETTVEKSTILSSVKYFLSHLSETLFTKSTLLTLISIAAALGALLLFVKLLRSKHHNRRPKYKYKYSKKMKRK